MGLLEESHSTENEIMLHIIYTKYVKMAGLVTLLLSFQPIASINEKAEPFMNHALMCIYS